MSSSPLHVPEVSLKAVALSLALCTLDAAAADPTEAGLAERIRAEVSRPGARAVLVNVWATWCVPCREEFPDLLRLERELGPRGLRLVLVSADGADARAEAEAFLRAQGVGERVASFFKGEANDEAFFAALDPAWTGTLPATFVHDARGALRAHTESRATADWLRRAVLPLLSEEAP